MLKQIKTRKHWMIPVSTIGMTLLSGAQAFAVGTADTAVTAAVTSMTDDVVATLAAVAPIAIGIFAAFLAWKYGKQMFKSVAGR